MRLHHKLMVVLALFGLLPTLIVGWLGRDAVRILERELGDHGRTVVRERLHAHLAAAMGQAAALVDHQRAVMELGVLAQTGAARDLLAPGRDEVPDRRAALEEAFADIRATLPEAFLWQTLVTADGETLFGPPPPEDAAWPAAAALPTPDQTAGRQSLGRGVVWTPPTFDPITETLVLTAAAPILDPATGDLLGVTAMGVSVLDTVTLLQERAALPALRAAMLVMPEGGSLRVLAWGEAADDDPWQMEGGGPGWTPRPGEGPSAATLRDLSAALREADAGVLRSPYGPDGSEDALWAFARLESFDGVLVFVVSAARAEALADGVTATVAEATNRQLAVTGAVMLGILVLAALGGWAAARTVSGPLVGLRRAVDRVAAGDLSARAPAPTAGSRDEVAALALRFNAMVPLLQDRMALRRALSLAQEVQQALLPARAPALPGFDIAGTSVYCDETGGDYFDYIPLRRDALGRPRRLAVLVGDVAGHGIASALMMTTTRALLRSHAEGSDEPGALLAAVNPLLAADAQGGRFMTAFALFLGVGQPLAVWSSAGHEPALLYDPQADQFEDLTGEDIPLGIDPDWMFAPSEARMLKPGDILVIGTDGVWESRDAKGAMFGKDRAREIIRTHREADAAGLVKAIMDAAESHRGPTPPRDDATVVVVKMA